MKQSMLKDKHSIYYITSYLWLGTPINRAVYEPKGNETYEEVVRKYVEERYPKENKDIGNNKKVIVRITHIDEIEKYYLKDALVVQNYLMHSYDKIVNIERAIPNLTEDEHTSLYVQGLGGVYDSESDIVDTIRVQYNNRNRWYVVFLSDPRDEKPDYIELNANRLVGRLWLNE